MYTLHERSRNGFIEVSLRFNRTVLFSHMSHYVCTSLQEIAEQIAENITKDQTHRIAVDLTKIPEPLASVVRTCIAKRRRHLLQTAKTYYETLKVMK